MEAQGYISCLLHLLCHNRGLGHQQNMLPQVQFKPVAFTSWMQQSPPVEPPWKVFCQPTHSRALAGLAHRGKLGNFVGNWSPGCSDIELWRALVSFYGILELCCWLRHGNLGSCSLKSGISAVFCLPMIFASGIRGPSHIVMTGGRESRRKAADTCCEVFLPAVSVVER